MARQPKKTLNEQLMADANRAREQQEAWRAAARARRDAGTAKPAPKKGPGNADPSLANWGGTSSWFQEQFDAAGGAKARYEAQPRVKKLRKQYEQFHQEVKRGLPANEVVKKAPSVQEILRSQENALNDIRTSGKSPQAKRRAENEVRAYTRRQVAKAREVIDSTITDVSKQASRDILGRKKSHDTWVQDTTKQLNELIRKKKIPRGQAEALRKELKKQQTKVSGEVSKTNRQTERNAAAVKKALKKKK